MRLKRKKGKTGKAQASMEYMIVVGFAMLMIMPALVIYATENENIKEQISTSQASQIARKIVDSANQVYYLGKPAKTTIKVFMPHNVKSIVFNGKTIIFNMQFGRSTTEVFETADVNLTGNISPNYGLEYISIKAEEDYVNVSKI